ncbi:hypothetical protein [Mesorhizobium sp. M7A.F.Ca.CA.002.12.1.1]|uniref:hypothetical protein n=1 Tax=Mesorhizobium sp. M7A.F.Ca.CA.002.12.1.1 TaxID=2496735 RepID=UPI000FCB1F1C|nr:hypothetical protein [Mesorhizobium sp. M7A.F.Ca.CA.002.12.1.1]
MWSPDPINWITVIGVDDFVRCPVCDHRVDDITDTPIGLDEDGPIYKARCEEHGEFKWQVEEED